MASKVDELQLTQLSDMVANRTGLHFPSGKLFDLERGLASAAKEFGFKDVSSCVDWLLSAPLTRHQIEILASYLTVGETYFFRDKNSFSILEEQILPKLIRSRTGSAQYLRIWSAGCATGEEPYSIAIMLRKVIPDPSNWNITIMATDINPHFLQKATRGIYSDWSFRDCPAWLKQRYFREVKRGSFEIVPEIKKMVTFTYHNLAEDTYPSLLNGTNAMDMIFCRNVLMYFEPQVMRRVLHNLYLCLVDDGWMIVSPSEYSQAFNEQFAAITFPHAIMYKKDSQGRSSTQLLSREDLPWTLPYEIDSRPANTAHSCAEKKEVASTLPRQLVLLPPADIRVESVNEEPDSYEKASTFFSQGRYNEAEEQLQQLLACNKDDPKVMALRARIYANQGKLGEAIHWCEQSIAADKLNPSYHYLHSNILQEQGKAEDAVCALKRALYLDQGYVLAHFALGNLMQRLDKLNESRKHFSNALSLMRKQLEEESLPGAEGITVGRLREIINTCLEAYT